jgi:hypothetical protein
MSVELTDPRLTAQTFLYGAAPQEALAAMRYALGQPHVIQSCGPAITRLTGEASRALNQELASITSDLLSSIDLGDVIIYAFRTHRRLVEAARATLRAPGSEEVVRLASQHVSSTHQPSVDLLVDNVRMHTLSFELTISFDIDVAVAVVRHRDLVALNCGKSLARGRMGVDGVDLIAREYPIDLRLAVHLKHPVPLLRAG